MPTLKGFHLILMSLCILCCGVIFVWGVKQYLNDSANVRLGLYGVGALLSGIGLGFYTRWFHHKLKGIEYFS